MLLVSYDKIDSYLKHWQENKKFYKPTCGAIKFLFDKLRRKQVKIDTKNIICT